MTIFGRMSRLALRLDTARRLQDWHQRPALKPGFSGRHNRSIRAASSDFEARRLLRQSARHRRERAPGTGPMLVPSLQRYQAYPLSKPGIDLCTLDFCRVPCVINRSHIELNSQIIPNHDDFVASTGRSQARPNCRVHATVIDRRDKRTLSQLSALYVIYV